MKFSSILPWLQPKIPLVKGILLYGNCEGMISFRVKCLQKIYSDQKYVGSLASSGEEALEILQALPGLFDLSGTEKCIFLNNITDTFLNKGKIIEILRSTPHVLVASSSKLSSRSKLVSAFQVASETALIPCYDVHKDEITEICQWLGQINHLKITPEALTFFIDYSITDLEHFFSIFDLLTLYAGQETLTEHQLKNILSDFTLLPTEKFNQHFFLRELTALNTLSQTLELSQWIVLIRTLIQDFMILLAFHTYGLKSSDLRNFWSKGLVKFAYPRLSLYEKSFPLWNLHHCRETLNALLELERGIKSTSPPTFTQMLHKLIELSGRD